MTSLRLDVKRSVLNVEYSRTSLKIEPKTINGAGAFSNSFSVAFSINKQA